MILEIKLDKAQYMTNDAVVATVNSSFKIEVNDIQIRELTDVADCSIHIAHTYDEYKITISGLHNGNYILCICNEWVCGETAFDIVNKQSEIVRYGFLSDFAESDDNSDIQCMKDWHLNAIQFYDWMYRHDQLVSEEDEYCDPLNRPTKLSVIKEKIDCCKQYGIRPFAYGAVYAATEKTFNEHPEWAIYTLDGEPMKFADWLYYMNISGDCGWSDYIINEYGQAAKKLGFEGIHMDTYGFPKNVFDSCHNKLNLAQDFKDLINKAAERLRSIDKNNGVIFNAVNNWPIEQVADSEQDVVYIEVWPPNDTYADLYRLVRNARELSNRNVVIAAYIKAFSDAVTPDELRKAELSFLYTYATITAAGGTHLALGENHGILCDSYYVKYKSLSSQFYSKVKKYCDFIVAYGQLLYNDKGTDISMTASGGINEDIMFVSDKFAFSPNGEPGKVWTIIRETSNRITINMINLSDNNAYWNEPKNSPGTVNAAKIRVRYDRLLKSVFTATPDSNSIVAEQLKYRIEKGNSGRIYEIDIPDINIWRVISIEME